MPTPHFIRKLDALPVNPGVYMMKAPDGRVIYVGKAKNLRQRVRSYFRPGHHDRRRRYRSLVRCIADVDYVLTGTEEEALILEALQIRGLRPRFNIALKEDREYPYVRITSERFPRFLPARHFREDGSRYFGPFSNIKAMYVALDFIVTRFGLRTCGQRLPGPGATPCLEFHLHRCTAPCSGRITEIRYHQAVEEATCVLQGRHEGILAELHTSMREAAETQRYEHASRCRDRLRALEFLRDRQKVWLDRPVNRDIVGCHREDERVSCSLLAVRDGHLQASHHTLSYRPHHATDLDVILALLETRYQDAGAVPDEVQSTHAAPSVRMLHDLVGEGVCPPIWTTPTGISQMQELADLNARRMLTTGKTRTL